jgi:hypothetical protein
LISRSPASGPLLIPDPEATTLVPPGWNVTTLENGSLVLTQ